MTKFVVKKQPAFWLPRAVWVCLVASWGCSVANLNKLAAVLDAMADYVDENETKKIAAVEGARKSRLDKIAAAHLSSHGEEMSDLDRQKLAKADDAALDYVENLLTKQGGVVDSLGAGVSPDNDVAPTTNKEAADAADKRFVDWIVS